MLPLLELLAVIASGTFGVLLARRKGLDFVGVFTVSLTTAFGGGTLRDLFLDRHPLFWIQHHHYPVIVFFLALTVSLVPRIPRVIRRALHVPDAIGLGLFSVVGTEYSLEAGTAWFVAALLGTITGTFGGVMGEIICNEVPSLFRSAPLCATCAFVGCWVYLLVQHFVPQQFVALLIGSSVIVLTRFAALYWNIQLPEFKPGDDDPR